MSLGTKVVQHVILHKILEVRIFLTLFTHKRSTVYRVISGNFFPSKFLKIFFIFLLYSPTQYLQNNHSIWSRNKKVMVFSEVRSKKYLSYRNHAYDNFLMKNKPNHENQCEKLYKMCEDQPNRRIPVPHHFE